MSNIRMLRVITGENVLAEIIDENANEYVLENAMHLVVKGTDQQGDPILALAPLNPLGKKERLTIKKTSIVYDYSPADELETQYRLKFGSGLVTPQPGLIIKP